MWNVRRGGGTPHVRSTCRRVPKTRQKLEIKDNTCYKGQYNALSTQKVTIKKKNPRLKRAAGAFFPSRSTLPERHLLPERQPKKPFWSVERHRDRLVIFFFNRFFANYDPPPH